MNILPKKRWHVRTKENIARVRRDEAKAAEEEKQKLLRIEIAEREARTELLRKRARKNKPENEASANKVESKQEQGRHVNFFYELEQNSLAVNKSNPEYEKEKKLEREKYEKQIGYLTYLGQDTNEITGNVSWYNVDPEERKKGKEEVAKDKKALEDPLREIRKYLGTDDVPKMSKTSETESEKAKKEKKTDTQERSFGERLISDYGFLKDKKKSKKLKKEKKKNKKKKKKKKRRKSDSSDSDTSSDSDDSSEKKKESANIEALRAQRLKRETEERRRAEMVLAKMRGGTVKEEKVDPEIEQKYNSQFNPHLAKQNLSKR